MSTKSTIKFREQTVETPGFHLYDEMFEDGVVYLRLDGVPVALETQDGPGASVTVQLPRDMAQALGLLPVAQGAAA